MLALPATGPHCPRLRWAVRSTSPTSRAAGSPGATSALGKLEPTTLPGHSSGGASIGSNDPWSRLGDAAKLISACPHIDVEMDGVPASCLVDTGSMVTTITESFFRKNFEPWGEDRLRACHWLELKATNGLAIPNIGYLELKVVLCDKLMPHYGVLVVRDPPGHAESKVPRVLGMNLICKCYHELFGQYGPALFGEASVSLPTALVEALQRCHVAIVQTPPTPPGRVRVRGKAACRVPGGMMKIVMATCSEQFSDGTVMFEPPEAGLPAGLLASPWSVSFGALLTSPL